MKGKRIISCSVFLFFTVCILSTQVLAKSWRNRLNIPVYYLSLGTSLAAGEQPDPDTCVGEVMEVSYPSIIAEDLKQDINKLLQQLCSKIPQHADAAHRNR